MVCLYYSGVLIGWLFVCFGEGGEALLAQRENRGRMPQRKERNPERVALQCKSRIYNCRYGWCLIDSLNNCTFARHPYDSFRLKSGIEINGSPSETVYHVWVVRGQHFVNHQSEDSHLCSTPIVQLNGLLSFLFFR